MQRCLMNEGESGQADKGAVVNLIERVACKRISKMITSKDFRLSFTMCSCAQVSFARGCFAVRPFRMAYTGSWLGAHTEVLA